MRYLPFLFLFLYGFLNGQDLYTPLAFKEKGDLLIEQDENYIDADIEYAKIHSNDTLYDIALYNRVVCNRLSGNFEQALDLAESALELNNEYIVDIYFNKIWTLDSLNRKEEAYQVVEQAEKRFPYNYNIKKARAILLESEGKFDEAISVYEKVILDEPLNFYNHLSLVSIAIKSGSIAHIALPLAASLALNPEGETNLSVLSYANQLTSSKINEELLFDSGLFKEDMEEINDLVANYVALDNSYEVPGEYDLAFIKQIYLIITESELTDGFYSQVYLKPFKKMVEKGKFPELAALIALQSENQSHKKFVEKNIDEIVEALGILRSYMDDTTELRDAPDGLTDAKVDFVFNDYGQLSGIGEYDAVNDILVGPVIFYNSLGSKNREGTLSNTGKMVGKWTWYYPDGTISRVANYNDGVLEGESFYYNENGVLINKVEFKNDKLDGTLENYKLIGYKFEDVEYKNGMKHGKNIGYYPDNSIYYEYNFYEGKYDGEYKVYYEDGSTLAYGKLKNDKYDGENKSYFRNGQLETLQNYTNGELHGDYVDYFENGNIYTEGKFKKGKKIGLWKEYNRAGALTLQENYDEKGKINGPSDRYDHLGRKETTYIQKKGVINELINYDINGEVISKFKKKGKKLVFENLDINGNLTVSGTYYDNKRVGEWRFYDNFGNITEKMIYEEGLLQGENIKYAPNDIEYSKSNYKDNELNGSYVEYYETGNIKTQAYYKDGQLEGRYIRYYPNDKIQEDEFYIEGMQVGESIYFNIDGSKYLIRNYDLGYLKSLQRFNKNEELIGDSRFSNGNAVDEYYFTQNKNQLKGRASYKGGKLNGAFNRYHVNGQPRTKGNYVNDLKNGTWSYHYYDGTVSQEFNAIYGDKEGKSKSYFEDGTLNSEVDYRVGRVDGFYKIYHENGKLFFEGEYANDVANGDFKYYNFNGEFLISYRYDNDVMVGYTYLDKDGKMKELIPISSGDVLVETYFNNGNKAVSVNLKNGYKNGNHTFYYSNGNVESKFFYINGDLDGEGQEFYEDGTMRTSKKYIRDNQTDITEYFYPDGTLARSENWLYDEKHGDFKYYDKQGKLLRTVKYHSDIPYEID